MGAVRRIVSLGHDYLSCSLHATTVVGTRLTYLSLAASASAACWRLTRASASLLLLPLSDELLLSESLLLGPALRVGCLRCACGELAGVSVLGERAERCTPLC